MEIESRQEIEIGNGCCSTIVTALLVAMVTNCHRNNTLPREVLEKLADPATRDKFIGDIVKEGNMRPFLDENYQLSQGTRALEEAVKKEIKRLKRLDQEKERTHFSGHGR